MPSLPAPVPTSPALWSPVELGPSGQALPSSHLPSDQLGDHCSPSCPPQGTEDFVGGQWCFALTQKSPLDISSFPRGLLPRAAPSPFSLSAPQISFLGFSNQTAQVPSSNLLSPNPGPLMHTTQQAQNQTKESIYFLPNIFLEDHHSLLVLQLLQC